MAKQDAERNNTVTGYDLQVKCSKDAKAWFSENWSPTPKQTLSLDYRNHYNKSQNKCFILVDYHFSWVTRLGLKR